MLAEDFRAIAVGFCSRASGGNDKPAKQSRISHIRLRVEYFKAESRCRGSRLALVCSGSVCSGHWAWTRHGWFRVLLHLVLILA